MRATQLAPKPVNSRATLQRDGRRQTIAKASSATPDWQRDVFPAGANATTPNTGWFGFDYRFDRSARLTFVGATDSVLLGALPTAGAYGAANNLNQVASVPNRGGLLRWSAAGMLESDGLCRDYTHDARGRLIRALRRLAGHD